MGDAKRHDMELVVEADAAKAAERAHAESWLRVILDLSHPSLTPFDFADTSTKVIAVGPHVHRANMQAAREAGFESVLTNGQFATMRTEIFAALANEE